MSVKNMTVVFSNLNCSCEWIARIISWLGVKVHYLNLSYSHNRESRFSRLFDLGITPLPIEDLNLIDNIHLINNGPYDEYPNLIHDALPDALIDSQEFLYDGVNSFQEKIRLSYRSMLNLQISGKMAIYARSYKEAKYYLVVNRIIDLLMPLRENNVQVVYFPDIFRIFFMFIASLKKILQIGKVFSCFIVNKKQVDNTPVDLDKFRVAFVVHKELSYGQLFNKTLFYSEDKHSEFNRNKMIHISYSGKVSTLDEKDTNWFYMPSSDIGIKSYVISMANSFVRSISHIRRFKDVLNALWLAGFYAHYTFYRKSLLKLQSVKLAVIDYEILCPKALLLAYESLGVETVAVQERFLTSFYKSRGVILTNYLSASEFCILTMRNSTAFAVDNYFEIGQYRSDNLLNNSYKLPIELESKKDHNKTKIIVALGHHTVLSKRDSSVSVVLSWSAHIHFLKDMIRLSKDTKNAFIIIRYKFIDWMELPIFSEILDEVSKANIEISTEYSEEFYSYKLCSFADLVIAKHTSLGDECLSRKIPVIFHDYTHNSNKNISSVFDYGGSDIVCSNYAQLLDVSTKILLGEGKEYLNNQSCLYGSLGDGNTRSRVHRWLELRLSRLVSQ
jgi:hypothetical protein